MNVKLKIKDSQIVSAMLFQDAGSKTGTPLPFSDSEFHWGNKWHAVLSGFSLECVSTRPSKSDGINKVTYKISHSGVAQSTLSDDSGSKVINTVRVFRHAGCFDGTLSLIYNTNGHRFAEFISTEFFTFMQQYKLDWMKKINMDSFIFEISGNNTLMQFQRLGEDCMLCKNARRELLTDGKLRVESTGERLQIHLEEANWALLIKHHLVAQRTERVLLTKRSFADLAEMPSFLSCMNTK